MHTGMLWFNNDPKVVLGAKIQQAVDYYEKKYGCKPNMCLLHPSMFEGQSEFSISGLIVRPYRPVLPGHIWIGIEDKP